MFPCCFFPGGLLDLFSFLLSCSRKISSVAAICSGSAADFVVQSEKELNKEFSKKFLQIVMVQNTLVSEHKTTKS
jgi:hypothetical protein